MPENQTIRKSDNRRVKEETVIQTGRRQAARVERMRGKAVAGALVGRDSGWRSHIHMWVNWQEQVGSDTDHATQGSTVGK